MQRSTTKEDYFSINVIHFQDPTLYNKKWAHRSYKFQTITLQ